MIPQLSGLIISIILIALFIIGIDVSKVVHKKKYYLNTKGKQKKEDEYLEEEEEGEDYLSFRESELKIVTKFTAVFQIVVYIFLMFCGEYFGLDFGNVFHISISSFIECLPKILLVIFINLVLYSGLIIQLVFGIEEIYQKSSYRFIMENVYAPFLEEFMYRGIIFNILKMKNFSSLSSGFISSFLFGVSHFRHIYDADYNIQRILFQVTYTTLFGLYSSYNYCLCNSLIGPIISHGICNTLQMPKFDYLHDRFVSEGKRKVITYLYIIGILGFFFLIFYCS